jgi:hypothetical protein
MLTLWMKRLNSARVWIFSKIKVRWISGCLMTG